MGAKAPRVPGSETPASPGDPQREVVVKRIFAFLGVYSFSGSFLFY